MTALDCWVRPRGQGPPRRAPPAAGLVGPSQAHLPISEGHWLPTLRSGSPAWPHPDSSPIPASRLPGAQCPPRPQPDGAQVAPVPSLTPKPSRRPSTHPSATPWGTLPTPWFRNPCCGRCGGDPSPPSAQDGSRVGPTGVAPAPAPQEGCLPWEEHVQAGLRGPEGRGQGGT